MAFPRSHRMQTRSQTNPTLSQNFFDLDELKFQPKDKTKQKAYKTNKIDVNGNKKDENAACEDSALSEPPKKRRRIGKTTTKTKKESKEVNDKEKKRKKITIEYDEKSDDNNNNNNNDNIISIKDCDFIEINNEIINEYNKNKNLNNKWYPNNWINVYNEILLMRQNKNGLAYNADVDNIGCACLSDKFAPLSVQRYHVLVGLLLSSQTKDPVTANAIKNLKLNFNGLTINEIANCNNLNKIDKCICKVGFHNKKTEYLYKTSIILRDKYNNDIPKTIKELCLLPGIGPKMAYICMQVAWNKNEGIGVDVHVHRITNLLGWTKKQCKTPEHTRKELESWIPYKLWPGINRLFVGFGQTVCKPKKPNCIQCKINHLCPIGKKTIKIGKNIIKK